MLTNIFEICLLKTSATTNISGCLLIRSKSINLLFTFLISSCLLTVIRYLTGARFVALTNVITKNNNK